MKLFKWSSILLVSLLFSVVLVESYLYLVNPFGLIVKGRNIDLRLLENSHSNFRIVENINPEKLDPFVLIRRNSLGFRGEQPPVDYEYNLKIFAVGGSTTACIVLGDGTTWPDHLFSLLKKKNDRIWGTNAGFDGHSTEGHLALIKQHILSMKPDIILFLVGINEPNDLYLKRMEALNKTLFDPLHQKPTEKSKIGESAKPQKVNAREEIKDLGISYKILSGLNLEYWAKYSQIAAALQNFKKQKIADELGLTHRVVDFSKLPSAELSVALKKETIQYQEAEPRYERHNVRKLDENLLSLEKSLISQHVLPQFKKNLIEFKRLSIENDFKVVLVTQPAIYGVGTDPDTGADLENMVLRDGNGEWGMGLTGLEKWKLLEAINDVSREFALQNDVLLIDLARELPKRSSYYYDYIHYSKEGAKKVAEIIEPPLCGYINENSDFECPASNSN